MSEQTSSQSPATPATVDNSLKSEYLVDAVFPTQEVHLVAGPSGAGKSTWLIKFIDNWRQGQPFFQHASHPKPFVYLSIDRSEKSVLRIFERLQIDPKNFRIEVLKKGTRKSHVLSVLQALLKKYPDTKVFFIEGFQSKTPDGKINDYSVVANYLTSLQEFCEDNDVTIIGVAHATKTTADDRYNNPRQRILGTVAWAGYTETIILIEPFDAENPQDSTRVVMILPRNAPERMYQAEFKNGMLVEKAKPVPPHEKFENWYKEHATDTEITTEEIIAKTGLPRRTAADLIKHAVDFGQLEQIKKGVYRKLAAWERADA